MATQKTRQYTADFFGFEKNGDKTSTHFADLLKAHDGGHAPAVKLSPTEDTKFQIRGIRVRPGGNVISGVFGRCRFGEQPEQAAENTDDSDVVLKPGHGLVEKNHFLFFCDLNLLTFQRNEKAGRYSHLQAYLNTPQFQQIALVPVLTEDSYQRLMDGGKTKKLEFSIKRPSVQLDDEDAFLHDYISALSASKAGSAKIVLSASRDGTLADDAKRALVALARYSRIRVARATMYDDNEVIDLLADRIICKMDVELGLNGRPTAESMFQALARAKDDAAPKLRNYFGA